MTDPIPPLDIGRLDQASAMLRDIHPPFFASIFRAFCAEDGVTREDALALTKSYIHAWVGAQVAVSLQRTAG